MSRSRALSAAFLVTGSTPSCFARLADRCRRSAGEFVVQEKIHGLETDRSVYRSCMGWSYRTRRPRRAAVLCCAVVDDSLTDEADASVPRRACLPARGLPHNQAPTTHRAQERWELCPR